MSSVVDSREYAYKTMPSHMRHHERLGYTSEGTQEGFRIQINMKGYQRSGITNELVNQNQSASCEKSGIKDPAREAVQDRRAQHAEGVSYVHCDTLRACQHSQQAIRLAFIPTVTSFSCSAS